MKTQERPVNLDLTKFSFPLPALASITHRITGVVLFVGIAFGLWALDLSLRSPEGFSEAARLVGSPFGGFVAWGLLTALAYHFVAGVKHLFMDWGFGETLEGARLGSQVTIAATLVLSVLAGVWVW